MRLFEVKTKWWYDVEDKIIQDITIVAGESYAAAASEVEKSIGNNLIGFSIMELEYPLIVDKEMLNYWKKEIEKMESED